MYVGKFLNCGDYYFICFLFSAITYFNYTIDGSLLIATAMDPLFFLLPVLERNASRFSPLYQLIRGDSSLTPLSSPPNTTTLVSSTTDNNSNIAMDYSILLQLPNIYELAIQICDDREGMDSGLENRFFRLNTDKVLIWLSQKISRTSQILQNKANIATAKARAAMNAFSTSSKLLETKEEEHSSLSMDTSTGQTSIAKGIEREQLAIALSLVGEYITDEWIVKVSDHMG